MRRRLLSTENDYCTTKGENEGNDDDLCERLNTIMTTIEDVTKAIKDDTINEDTVKTLDEQLTDLREVIKEVKDDPSIIEKYDIDEVKMKEKTNDVKQVGEVFFFFH